MTGVGALEALGVLGKQSCAVTPALEHVELFTRAGLLTVLRHGDPAAEVAVVCVGGAMGGLLGPAGGLYQRLGDRLAAAGHQVLRVAYRRPNDLDRCTHDAVAACELAAADGATRFVVLGHSFGGAVAVQAGVALQGACAAVVTFATQSAGTELAGAMADSTRLLLVHGDRDEILPVDCSLVVRELAGRGEVDVVHGAGHLLAEAGERLDERVLTWLAEALNSR